MRVRIPPGLWVACCLMLGVCNITPVYGSTHPGGTHERHAVGGSPTTIHSLGALAGVPRAHAHPPITAVHERTRARTIVIVVGIIATVLMTTIGIMLHPRSSSSEDDDDPPHL